MRKRRIKKILGSSSFNAGVFTQQAPEIIKNSPLSANLSTNRKIITELFTKCADIAYRNFIVGQSQTEALIVFIQGLVEEKIINDNIMKSMLDMPCDTESNTESLFSAIKQASLEVADLQELLTYGELVDAILNGYTVLLINGTAKALRMGTKSRKSRSISEPITESVVRGPREGFTEDLVTNTTLLRRRIKSYQLKLESYNIGRSTKTEVKIAYLEDVVNKKVVEEVKKRLARIDVDSILESSYIEELIEDEPYTLFPQIQHSERPDRIAAAILEGRVAIFIDGTPFVLIVPSILIQFLQSSEDYYERFPYSIAVRIIRLIFFITALLLPASYIAATTFHHEMVPTSLLISIAEAHVGVPFPAFVEALLMEISLEALREAGVRLPRPVGQAVSIVGALVIGEAAVQAGLVSPAMVIVVALTAIASFSIPSFDLAFALRISRFIMMILGATLGFYGVMMGVLVLLFHLTSLRSFGVPYFTPVAPLKLRDFKDVLVRNPWWAMNERPSYLGMKNRQRQKVNLKPHPPEKK